jgi:outer membrane cobalamin receptor
MRTLTNRAPRSIRHGLGAIGRRGPAPTRFGGASTERPRRAPVSEIARGFQNFLFVFTVLVLAWSRPAWAAPVPAGVHANDPSAITLAREDAKAPVVDELTVIGQRPLIATGPNVSPTGANDYAVTARDIANLPTGGTSPMTDVLAQMPGVAIDQNQQIHIRNTEGPQFQYQINGVLVPLDINTNPSFLSMINPLFVRRLDLLDGVLPSRYSYATGGVVDIQTKDGCEQPGGGFTMLGGQRGTLQPSAQYGGCDGRLGYYVSGLYGQGETAFSSATPAPNPIHDFTNQGQAFGFFSYQLDTKTRLSLVLSAAASNNQLPNVPNLAPQFVLAGVNGFQSANVNSHLNFRDYLGILALNGSTDGGLTYQLAYSAHFISQDFRPDNAGELIFQGVASTASHHDVDNTLEGDLTYGLGDHALGVGFYAGDYLVSVDDSSLVFPVDANGQQSSVTPVSVTNNTRAANVVLGIYLNDLWRINDRLRADIGVRLDGLSGFTSHEQVDPTVNLSFQLTKDATIHGGFARYMQVPSFQGISPTAPTAFAGTTAEGPPGIPTPLTEDDYEWDVGLVYHLGSRVTLSQDNYYERTDHYLDTGQFGVVPIFAPFNYGHGYIWGGEFAINYKSDNLSAYANLTLGQNWQKGVATGQFNFDPDELAFIDSHYILLDHQPLAGASAGVTYKVNRYSISLDAIYSSGLRGGFADQRQLPTVVQVNASVERAFDVPGVGRVIDRVTILNAFDRVNLIRPAEGIGIFQSAYGPRFTVLDSLTMPF